MHSLKKSQAPLSPVLFISVNRSSIYSGFFFYLLILERGRERGEREKRWFVVLLIDAFIGWFLYVAWPGFELTILGIETVL